MPRGGGCASPHARQHLSPSQRRARTAPSCAGPSPRCSFQADRPAFRATRGTMSRLIDECAPLALCRSLEPGREIAANELTGSTDVVVIALEEAAARRRVELRRLRERAVV